MKSWLVLLLVALAFRPCSHHPQSAPPSIRLNQLGYYPLAPKLAIITGEAQAPTLTQASVFFILTADGQDTVFRGSTGPVTASANSSLYTRVADFGALQKEGRYILTAPGIANSYSFRIGSEAARSVALASLKGYYYQRSALALDPQYAGQWSRPAGHPDTAVLIHSSAVSPGRPAGTVISSPGGWYDAGDYNKYIVNSGITMGTLLSAYEDFPAWFDSLHTNIPPGPGQLPDILEEVLYNLRWMLTMQDPGDGGVYNKCTNAAFDGMVMPGVTKKPRYVVAKGTAATLDFAAVMAQSSRILQRFPRQVPGLADSCGRAARAAWDWALKNPALAYDQDAMNKIHTPPVTTGGYGDRSFKDEWFWAAAELMASDDDNKDAYKKVVLERIGDSTGLPNWANVHMLGNYTLMRTQSPPALSFTGPAQRQILQLADHYLAAAPANAFHTVMGTSRRDFIWGSNAVAANQGILLINAWRLTKDKKYFDQALGNLDYLLGRNATGYCFITGMGNRSPMHPHHRPSIADGIVPPVPGLLVGGPNPGRQDHVHYELTEPETSYTDQDAAYAANEIAINWNAPLVYLSAALEALQYRVGYSAGKIGNNHSSNSSNE
jgi:endoglucanase